MKKFLVLVVFAAATTTLQASTIASGSVFYSAYISCATCVTVTLSWAAQPYAVTYAEVDDAYGDFLFSLHIGSPSTTGAISPDPQTISGLSSSIIYYVTNGQAGVAVASIEPQDNGPTLASLDLLDSDMNLVTPPIPFAASPEASSVPEPAAWTLAGAGLVFLLMRARIQRRNSRAVR